MSDARKSDGDRINAEPRLLISACRRARDGTYLGSSGCAHPLSSGPAALDAAIESLERLRTTITREPSIDWHIQINIRPAAA